MALTAMVPVVGALVFSGEPSTGGLVEVGDELVGLILLFMVGAMLHVHGFVLNEWADVEVDRASKDLQDKPLVSGALSGDEAKWTAVLAAVLCFVFLALVTLDPWAHLAMLGSVLLAVAYDLWGKRFPLDVLLAGSITFLLLTGAIALGGFDPSHGPHLILFACLGGLQFLQNLYQNAIEGGIKDADHDAAAGARTYAALLGVRVLPSGELVGGRTFTSSALLMKAAQLSLVLYTAVEVTDLSSHGGANALWVILAVAMASMVVTTGLMLPSVTFDRSRLKRIFSIHELATVAAILVVVIPLVGEWTVLGLFVLPMVWFMLVNRLLFGGSLEPGV
jgi:4-hydroxybenzoate polyprenyltransferase